MTKKETRKVTTKVLKTLVENKSELVLTNMRNGKVFICGQYLNTGESVTVHEKMQKDDQQKKLINNAIRMGLVKKS